MSNGTAQRRARRAQVSAELARFREELKAWFNRWQSADAREFHEKHGRQLQRLQATLMEALAGLAEPLQNLSLEPPTGDVYKKCHDFELRLIWLRRIWDYYRGKFEQRLERSLQPLLQAADEVVWACYAPTFRSLNREPPAPPLPYIEPLFTPRAIPRDEPPPELKSDVDDEFREAILAALPVAMISLPPACVTAPWWLAHVAHEAGHHLQHELDLVKPFQQVLAAAARALLRPDAPEGAADKWLLWNEEIFADLVSILCLGAAAPRSLSEVELTSDAIGTGYGKYPATVVRLELMRQGLRHLKASDADALGEAMDEQFIEACQHLPATTDAAFNIAGRVASTALAVPLCGSETLADLASWDKAGIEDSALQHGWAECLRNGKKLAEAATPLTVRGLVVAGWRLGTKSWRSPTRELRPRKRPICRRHCRRTWWRMRSLETGPPDSKESRTKAAAWPPFCCRAPPARLHYEFHAF
jgi:hypothetical protein